MESAYFIYPKGNGNVNIIKFHNCTWEFNNNSALVEFGMEVDKASLANLNALELTLYIPWLTDSCKTDDFYGRLKDSANSKFIFNDSVVNIKPLDGGDNNFGVIHTFAGKGDLCLLPLQLTKSGKKIQISVNLAHYNAYTAVSKPNIYIRFSVEPSLSHISVRKNGISKSTVIYDVKLNERRNIPDELKNELASKSFCKIDECFCFNILPNNYDIVFFENAFLKNVRNLEYPAFRHYINDPRLKKDELIVIFNKKEKSESYSFFSIYAKERIGIAQFSLAILLNTFCGTLFFIACFRYTPKPGTKFFTVIWQLPKEVYIAIFIMLITLGYFVWPFIKRLWPFKKGKK